MCWEKFLKIRCAWTSFFIKNCTEQTSHFKNYGVVPPSGRYKEISVNLLEVQKTGILTVPGCCMLVLLSLMKNSGGQLWAELGELSCRGQYTMKWQWNWGDNRSDIDIGCRMTRLGDSEYARKDGAGLELRGWSLVVGLCLVSWSSWGGQVGWGSWDREEGRAP